MAVSTADKVAVIAGGTGLVGGACLRLLLENLAYSRVVALVRRTMTVSHPKLEQIVTPLDNLGSIPTIRAHHAFCALGTTMKKAGSKEAFRIVDHDLVANFAYWTRSCGADSFAVVSSVGANAESRVFYLRTKGEMEEAVREQWFPRLDIFRPAFLEGHREEDRPNEKLTELLCRGLNPICVGPIAKYHTVAAKDVARAMIASAQQDKPGTRVYHYREILDLAKTIA